MDKVTALLRKNVLAPDNDQQHYGQRDRERAARGVNVAICSVLKAAPALDNALTRWQRCHEIDLCTLRNLVCKLGPDTAGLELPFLHRCGFSE